MRDIRVIRKSGYYGVVRKLNLYVDGSLVGSVKNGGTEFIQVPANAATIMGKMDWGKTDSLPIAELDLDDAVVFESYFTFNPLRNLGLMALPFRVYVSND